MNVQGESRRRHRGGQRHRPGDRRRAGRAGRPGDRPGRPQRERPAGRPHDQRPGRGGRSPRAWSATPPTRTSAARSSTCCRPSTASPSICVPAAGITRDQLAVKIDKETGKATVYPLEDFRLGPRGQPDRADVLGDGDDRPDRRGPAHARASSAGTPRGGIQGTIVFIGSISSQGNPGPGLLRGHQGGP